MKHLDPVTIFRHYKPVEFGNDEIKGKCILYAPTLQLPLSPHNALDIERVNPELVKFFGAAYLIPDENSIVNDAKSILEPHIQTIVTTYSKGKFELTPDELIISDFSEDPATRAFAQKLLQEHVPLEVILR